MSVSMPLNIDEVNAIAQALNNPRDQAAFLISCGCGLRAGALCSLTIAAVLDARHELTGRVDVPRRAQKGRKKSHSVALPKRALTALANWISVHPAPHRAAPLFPSSKALEKNITPRHWHRIFTTAARAAGVTKHVSPHSARKFFAHAVYEGTEKDIQLTTRALGNCSPSSTLYYLDFGQRRIQSATLQIFDDASQKSLDLEPAEKNSSIKTTPNQLS